MYEKRESDNINDETINFLSFLNFHIKVTWNEVFNETLLTISDNTRNTIRKKNYIKKMNLTLRKKNIFK